VLRRVVFLVMVFEEAEVRDTDDNDLAKQLLKGLKGMRFGAVVCLLPYRLRCRTCFC
jgi:hypothetical protein